MVHKALKDVVSKDDLLRRASFRLEALERRSLLSASSLEADSEVHSPSSDASEQEHVTVVNVRAAVTSQTPVADAEENQAESELESESEDARTQPSVRGSTANPVAAPKQEDDETEKPDATPETTEHGSSSTAATSDEESSDDADGSEPEAATSPPVSNSEDTGTTPQSDASPASESETKAVQTADTGAESTSIKAAPFAGSPESATVAGTEPGTPDAQIIAVPLAAISGFGAQYGAPLSLNSGAISVLDTLAASAEISVARLFSNLPITTSSIADTANVLSSLTGGHTAQQIADATVPIPVQLAVPPVLRHFARLGNPMLFLNDSLAMFADESALGTPTPIASRVHRAWLITTAVLAVDAVLLFHMRKTFARRKLVPPRRTISTQRRCS